MANDALVQREGGATLGQVKGIGPEQVHFTLADKNEQAWRFDGTFVIQVPALSMLTRHQAALTLYRKVKQAVI